MNIKELEIKYPIHDSTITKIVYNDKAKTLQINSTFSKGHLNFIKGHNSAFDFKLKSIEMLFSNVENLRSYTDLSNIVKEKNDILGIYVKKNKKDKQGLVTIALDHCVPPKPIDEMGDWFFIEFYANDVEIKEIE